MAARQQHRYRGGAVADDASDHGAAIHARTLERAIDLRGQVVHVGDREHLAGGGKIDQRPRRRVALDSFERFDDLTLHERESGDAAARLAG